jgi:hypothetical protein
MKLISANIIWRASQRSVGIDIKPILRRIYEIWPFIGNLVKPVM